MSAAPGRLTVKSMTSVTYFLSLPRTIPMIAAVGADEVFRRVRPNVGVAAASQARTKSGAVAWARTSVTAVHATNEMRATPRAVTVINQLDTVYASETCGKRPSEAKV